MRVEDNSYLDVINNSQRPQIRANVFIEKFLPILLNDPNPAAFNLKWINEVSMNPYLAVDAINQDGSLAFVIPPLRSPIKTVLDPSLQHLANLAKMEYQVHPIKGNLFLNANLPRMMQFENARNDDIQQQWNALLVQLGHKKLLVDTTTPEAPLKVDVGIIGADEDWD